MTAEKHTNYHNMDLNLAQIDRLLNDWKQKIDAVNQNLLDLDDLSVYQRVSGKGNPPDNLMGITQQRVGVALTAVDRLFADLDLLIQTIDRAKLLRLQLPALFINNESLQEIHQILVGESIQLSTIQTPLAQRDLLSPAQQLLAISPAKLLERMMADFANARDIFTAVETAWTELQSKLISDSQALIELQQLAEKLQIPIPPALNLAQSDFTKLQLEIDRDPLGINHPLDRDLTALINATRQELETLNKQRQWLEVEFVTAKQKMVHLRQLNQDAMSAQVESQIRITHHFPMFPQLPPQDLSEISQWLGRLEISFQAGNIAAVHVGLKNWLNKMEAYTHAAQSALTANRRPVDTRQELRGRLDALTAKALAKGKAEDPTLADLAIQAHQILYSTPTPLALAMNLVEQYQQRLDRQSHN